MLGMGYVSPRHLAAIKATGGELVAYHDIMDVVGHVDGYFINARYYPDFIHFDCFADRNQIDYCVVLLPNHLHNPACRWAMNHGMDVICEKPLVLREKNLDELLLIEERTGKRVSTILQMRLHASACSIVRQHHAQVKIVYHTPRGHWFRHGSWKANQEFSGGLATSIGVHLFDLCGWSYGNHLHVSVDDERPNEYIRGHVYYERADVSFDLSVAAGSELRREFIVDGVPHDFTVGFNDLHTKSYERILSGDGFGIEDAREAVRITERIRG